MLQTPSRSVPRMDAAKLRVASPLGRSSHRLASSPVSHPLLSSSPAESENHSSSIPQCRRRIAKGEMPATGHIRIRPGICALVVGRLPQLNGRRRTHPKPHQAAHSRTCCKMKELGINCRRHSPKGCSLDPRTPCSPHLDRSGLIARHGSTW